ncbi:MAG: protein-L-isoaspartate(D-aspartate) O-methyltransferase [Candidatus Omnitrophota bacterium]
MEYSAQREKMVTTQLMPRGIKDRRVLEAFRNVARHELVPQKLRGMSYEDHPLPIGENQTISQPYMVALMTESLCLKGDEKVLEIGTGSGYQAAILSSLARDIYSVERVESLAIEAKVALDRLGVKNVKINVGDGTLGWPENAPYDGIIVTAAAPKVPDAYIDQLTIGGRLVIPLGTMYSQILTVIEKRAGGINKIELCGCVFVPLLGEEGWSEK